MDETRRNAFPRAGSRRRKFFTVGYIKPLDGGGKKGEVGGRAKSKKKFQSSRLAGRKGEMLRDKNFRKPRSQKTKLTLTFNQQKIRTEPITHTPQTQD